MRTQRPYIAYVSDDEGAAEPSGWVLSGRAALFSYTRPTKIVCEQEPTERRGPAANRWEELFTSTFKFKIDKVSTGHG